MKKNLMLLFACLLSLQVFSQNLYPNDELIVMFDDNTTPAQIQSLLSDIDMYIIGGPTQNYNAYLLKYTVPPQIPTNGNPWDPINGDKKKAKTNTEVTSAGFNFELAANNSQLFNLIDQTDNHCYDILNPITQPNGGNNITTAIFDTGFPQNLLTGNNFIDFNDLGHNYVNPNLPPIDDHDHGSHITSIIMNNLDNNNSAVKLKSYKTHNSQGEGRLWDVIEALDQAITDQVQVINLSFGYYIDQEHSTEIKVPLRLAIKKAELLAGILCIAAAGNDNNDNDFTNQLSGKAAYPASFDQPNIISVASSNCNLDKSSFSNYGQTSVDVFAPGEDIWGYGYQGYPIQMSGTSQSTGFVSKLATFLGTYQQNFDWELTKCAILNTTVLAESGYVLTDGYINSANALAFIQNSTDCTDNPQNRIKQPQIVQKGEFIVFPYPASEIFNITSDRDVQTEISITSINGQILYQNMVDVKKGSYDYNLDLSNHIDLGIYLFSIKDKNGINTFKFTF